MTDFAKMMCSRCFKYSNELGHSLKKCGGCGQNYYCSQTCQKLDWKKHKPYCKLRSEISTPCRDAVVTLTATSLLDTSAIRKGSQMIQKLALYSVKNQKELGECRGCECLLNIIKSLSAKEEAMASGIDIVITVTFCCEALANLIGNEENMKSVMDFKGSCLLVADLMQLGRRRDFRELIAAGCRIISRTLGNGHKVETGYIEQWRIAGVYPILTNLLSDYRGIYCDVTVEVLYCIQELSVNDVNREYFGSMNVCENLCTFLSLHFTNSSSYITSTSIGATAAWGTIGNLCNNGNKRNMRKICTSGGRELIMQSVRITGLCPANMPHFTCAIGAIIVSTDDLQGTMDIFNSYDLSNILHKALRDFDLNITVKQSVIRLIEAVDERLEACKT